MAFTAVLFAGVFSAWAAIGYFQIRHAGLAALAVILPLPIWFLGNGIALRLDAILVSFITLFACVFGFVCALCVADRIARGMCDGLASREAVRNAISALAVPILSVVMACGFSQLVVLLPYNLMDCLAVTALLLIAFGAAMGMGWLARWLPYSERFIAEANAAREIRERWIARLSFVSAPRWALSLSGIAMVLGAIAFFGARSPYLQGGPGWLAARYGEVAIVTFVLFALALRNWRLALAQVLTLLFEMLFGLWPISPGPMAGLSEDRMLFAVALAINAIPLMWLAWAVNGFLREGDEITTAILRALQQTGSAALSATIAATIPWLVVTISGGIARFEFAAGVAAIVATPLIFLALTGTIYTLLPRYRSVEEVFGKR